MLPLSYYIDLLESGDEMDVILNLFDLHKNHHETYLKIKRALLERLHEEGASDRLVKLALICFILAKMPTLDDVAKAYDYYLPLTNLMDLENTNKQTVSEAFNAFCDQNPDAQSCRIYDI